MLGILTVAHPRADSTSARAVLSVRAVLSNRAVLSAPAVGRYG